MGTPRVTIVILTWNGLAFTTRCLESLRRNTEGTSFDLIVVDNGSTDGSVEFLRAQQGIRLIENPTNLGFAKANNQAIAAADPQSDILLLNNDTEIPVGSGDWLGRMAATARAAPDVGIAGCRIRRPNGMLQHCGAYMPLVTFWGQQTGSNELDVNQYPFDREVESVVFACVYIRRELIAAIGTLTEEYFAYFEDTDYCLRARAAGFKTMCCGSVTIVHHENVSTRENKVSHSDLFKKSQSVFKKRWARALEARYTRKLVWLSTVSRPHGYGMTSKDLLLELDRRNVEVAYRYLYGRGTVFPVDEPQNTEFYQINVMKQRSMPRGVPHVVYGQGDAFLSNEGPYKIGFTMLEVTGIPDEWVLQANLMDEVWVPSEFNRLTFADSGVTKPIHVMPLGVDTNYFNPQIVRHDVCDEFKFLTVFEWGERKAPEAMLKAFNSTFSARDPVVLLCKTNVTDPGIDIRSELDAMRLSPTGGRIEFILNKYVPYYQLGALYRSADCFVLPTRGEGWGMPLLEAMACGLPVISTYWSAPTAFMTGDNSYPLQVKRLVNAVAKCPYYAGFKWAEPDYDHLCHLLRHVFEHRDEARAKGARAAADVAAQWTVSHAGGAIAARIEQIAAERGSAPSAHASAIHAGRTPCVAIDVSRAIGEQVTGIGRYTMNLVEGLARHGGEGMSFMLLPGFGTFVHPEYGRRYQFEVPEAKQMMLYRGPLPAFSGRETVAPGVDLLHSTAFMTPAACTQPLVYTVHDLSFLTHPMFHTLENIEFCKGNIERAIKRDTVFIAVSGHTKKDLVALLGVEPSRIHVIPNSFDGARFRPQQAEALAAVKRTYTLPERYLLFLASIEPRKNLQTALDAVRATDLGCPLVIAGAKGWMNTPLDAAIAACGSRVLPVGYVAQADLAPLYAGARALVYPSLYEGFGLPVLEAMACGTPVICAAVSSLPEVAGAAGILLANPVDAEALAAAIKRLAEDDAERARRAEAGIAQAATFSLERCTGLLIQLYRSVLGG